MASRRYCRMPRTSIACSYTVTAPPSPISINAESAHRKSSITCESVTRPARLRGWLMEMGHPLAVLSQAGLVTAAGYDAYMRRIVFPLEGNLYGRSISASAPPHRFLPGSKGGLYRWDEVRRYREVILVEGLFDYAVLWQAGFPNVTCGMGTHLNRHQLWQLSCHRTVYLALDADSNGSGQQAAQSLANRLRKQGLSARIVSLPEGHDPNSWFVQGGDARQFQSLLENAQP